MNTAEEASASHRPTLSEMAVLLPGKLQQRAKLIAGQGGPVLVRGDSGTGKSLISRLLHMHSHFSSGPFVVRRCSELEDASVNRILFGEVDGDQVDSPGLFEKAEGGVLVLEDIDQLPRKAQARLVRLLDEGQFTGGRNVMLIATTACDLDYLVREDAFLLDFWYQLRKWRIKMPGLRDRPKDIRHLASFFLNDFQAENTHVMGDEPAFFSEEVLYLFAAMPWHGNLRELKDAVHNLALFVEGPRTPIHLKQAAEVIFDRDYYYRSSDNKAPENDEEHLHHVLESTSWNTSITSRITGIPRGEIADLMEKKGWGKH